MFLTYVNELSPLTWILVSLFVYWCADLKVHFLLDRLEESSRSGVTKISGLITSRFTLMTREKIKVTPA